MLAFDHIDDIYLIELKDNSFISMDTNLGCMQIVFEINNEGNEHHHGRRRALPLLVGQVGTELQVT